MTKAKALSVPRQIAVEIFIMALIGLVLGFLGPFETYAMPLGFRLAYWVGFIIVGYVIFRPMSVCATWLAQSTGISVWVAALFATAIGALPLAFLIGFAMTGMRITPTFFGNQFLLLYLQCAGIGFGIYALMRLIFKDIPSTGAVEVDHPGISLENGIRSRQIAEAKMATPPTQPISTRLHNRLPVGFPNEILALSVEDHYVRVHAADQSEMVLLRLSDAISEVSEQEGMQVHRSWWVARDAIKTPKRQGRNLKLVLSNGQEIPVSRSYVGKLKQTGWI